MRRPIAGQLLAEGVTLSLAGGILGTLLAVVGARLLAHLGSRQIPRLAGASLDLRLLLFALSVSIATGILFAVMPAIHASRANLNAALRCVKADAAAPWDPPGGSCAGCWWPRRWLWR